MTSIFHSIAEAFKEGGGGMWPILAIFLISLAIAIERIYLPDSSRASTRTSFMGQLGGLLQGGNVAGRGRVLPADRQAAGAHPRPPASPGATRACIACRRAMDEAAYGEMPRIEKRTGYLALMGNVATLTGLLGTILGLIKSFRGVSKEAAADKATLLAAGISEAMNCTAFGLLTGIAALLAYSVLNGKTQAMMDEINHLSLKAMRAWRAAAGGASEHAERKPIVAPAPHLMHHVRLGKKGGGHGTEEVHLRQPAAHPDDRHVHRGAHLPADDLLGLGRDPLRHQGHQAAVRRQGREAGPGAGDRDLLPRERSGRRRGHPRRSRGLDRARS